LGKDPEEEIVVPEPENEVTEEPEFNWNN